MNLDVKNRQFFRSCIYYLAAIIFFLGVSVVYFSPTIFDGKVLHQADVSGASGTGRDALLHKEKTGEQSYWTNSLFGGMPTYQISPSYPSTDGISRLEKFVTFRFPFNILSGDSWLLFALMIGFFIFMRSMNISKMLSISGTLLWTFSSYFLILIVAGHIWKLETIAFVPPTIAGVIWAYRGKYLKGLVVMSIFATIQIFGNHIQMSYYFAFVMLAIVLAFIFDLLRKKDYKHIAKATSICILAGIIAIAANATNLYHTYTFSKQTMRGGTVLSSDNNNEGNKKGLSSDYITQWSYGKAETLSLLIPNIHGGGSSPIGNSIDVDANSKINPNFKEYIKNMPSYWGEQPFTVGPVYVGAFVFMLFILGCFCVKGSIKWALLVVTILSVILSWGRNFMPITQFFIDYIPLYSKFRAVSSILVIAEFTIPTLAILALSQFFKDPKNFVRDNRRYIIFSLLITVGIPILIMLLPGLFFDFVSSTEKQFINDNLGNPLYKDLYDQLAMLRQSLLVSDSIRTVIIIIVSLLPLYYYYKKGINRNIVILVIGAISLIDLWNVDKRYLNNDSFEYPIDVETKANPETYADRMIEQDKDLHYRVINLSVNTFNDATTSYRHRSVGGYSAVKLQRYQDIIDHELQKRFPSPVLDMLDVRYFIVPDSATGTRAILNPNAYGSAWLPDSIVWVKSPDEEMSMINNLQNLKNVAIIDSENNPIKDKYQIIPDSSDFVELTKYLPNEAVYKVSLKNKRFCVFSDIYYPDGWELYAGDRNIPIVRTNYLLRGAELPEGSYEVKMTFKPKSIKTTEAVSRTAVVAVIIILLSYIMVYTKENFITKDSDKSIK